MISSKKLEDLPNELLAEITVLVYLNQAEHVPACKEFDIIHALSLVSRRMRAIVLPLLRRRLAFTTAMDFVWALALEYDTMKRQPWLASVRLVSFLMSCAYQS